MPIKARRFQSVCFFEIAGLLFLSGCAGPQKSAPILATVPSGELRWIGDLPVLRLRGTSYEMGYQHGTLMRRQVRASVKNLLAFADRQMFLPGLGRVVARRKLDRAWRQMKPRMPERFLEEMKGLSDGAQVSLRDLQRIHALPESVGGATLSNVQKYSTLIIYEPKGQRSFVSIGWLGFIGVLSGVNRQRVSVAATGESFTARRVLEESDDPDQAAKIIETVPPETRRRLTVSRMDQKTLEIRSRGRLIPVDLEDLF